MKRDPLPVAISPGPHPSPGGWRVALPAVLIALAGIVAGYAGTAHSLASTWYRSETFAHGFVVLPISLWLVWRIRDTLRALDPRPSWIALPLLAGAGCAWLAGQLGIVNALSQAAFVGMLVLAVPAILGVRVARAMLFPLGFLFFAVPIGDFLLPTLMERTADFTVLALRASGVPVYRDGLLLVLPTGRWSIVEACSGVRYLIASLMVGTLFAYLNYRAHWRRLVFVGVSIVVPIVANWLRAYLIVLLGHLSNNKLAAGVDHLIYGWIFFGFVMLLMFWIGARWREPAPAAAAGAAPVAASRPPASRREQSAAVAAVVAIALAWPWLEARIDAAAVASPPALALPEVPGWRAVARPPARAPRFESASAALDRAFERDGATAHLYVAYYRGQDVERKLVSSDNALVRSDDRGRRISADRTVAVALGGRSLDVRETRVETADGRSYVAWRWYWIDTALTSSDSLAKARIAWSKLVRQRDDSAVVIVYAEEHEAAPAVATLRRFTQDAWPPLAAALARAEAAR
jgi:exosortase A